jgi:GLPGLI family protein
MKKIFVLMGLIVSACVCAQVKEGFVKYTMTIEGTAGTDMAKAMLGNSTITIYFKNGKSLTDMKNPIFNTKTLLDNNGLLMLMEGANQKFYTRKTKAEIDQEKAMKKNVVPSILFTQEKKKILGYDCVKATMTMSAINGKIPRMTMWYTDKIANLPTAIGPVDENMMSKLKGMVLEIDLAQGNVNSKMVATEVSSKPVSDAVFNVSTAGYTERKMLPRAGALPR